MGYESVGMMEFVVDMFSGDFNFMEMNTWLQVSLNAYLIILF